MAELLRCIDVSKTYQEGERAVDVLKQVSFTIDTGEQVAILGSSGSGKSTLLHLLGTLDQPSSGQIWFQGDNVYEFSANQKASFRNKYLGFIYQFHHLLPEFSALENVAMPLLIGRHKRTESLKRATTLLHRVGLANRLDHKPNALSGGERQRVAIARALITKPKLVLADEPTGNLDHKTGDSIYRLITELRDELDTSFIVVTHDIALAHKLDRVLHISDGELSEADKAEVS